MRAHAPERGRDSCTPCANARQRQTRSLPQARSGSPICASCCIPLRRQNRTLPAVVSGRWWTVPLIVGRGLTYREMTAAVWSAVFRRSAGWLARAVPVPRRTSHVTHPLRRPAAGRGPEPDRLRFLPQLLPTGPDRRRCVALLPDAVLPLTATPTPGRKPCASRHDASGRRSFPFLPPCRDPHRLTAVGAHFSLPSCAAIASRRVRRIVRSGRRHPARRWPPTCVSGRED